MWCVRGCKRVRHAAPTSSAVIARLLSIITWDLAFYNHCAFARAQASCRLLACRPRAGAGASCPSSRGCACGATARGGCRSARCASWRRPSARSRACSGPSTSPSRRWPASSPSASCPLKDLGFVVRALGRPRHLSGGAQPPCTPCACSRPFFISLLSPEPAVPLCTCLRWIMLTCKGVCIPGQQRLLCK